MLTNALLRKTAFGTSLPIWIQIWLKEQRKSTTSLIEEAVISHYGLIPPEKEGDT